MIGKPKYQLKRGLETCGRHLQECLQVSHPYVISRGYGDTARPWLDKKMEKVVEGRPCKHYPTKPSI